MDAITAKCPQCGTQYQLTQEQLSVANGQVRCGACMTVFQAVPAPAAPPPPTPKAASNKPHKSQFVNDEDDLLLKDTGVRESFDTPQDFATGEFSNTFQNLDAIDDNPFATEMDDTASFQHTDESWAEQLLAEADDEDGEDTPDFQPQDSDAARDPEDQPRKALGSSSDDFNFDDFGLDEELSLSKEEKDELSFALGNDDKDNMLERITPEPLEFEVEGKPKLWVTVAMGFSSVLAVVILATQIFYFQFEELARTPEWRGFYTSVCNTTGCELPSQYRIEDISANHLTVKSHSYYRDALIVDAIITNHAQISQPFPNIEVYFFDINQKVVAARSFQPSDYLRGELESQSMMPIQTGIHVALEINDLGAQPPGYRMLLSY